ncbi:hypothetical protein pb186bvf_019651 [Paramecium bursaria]
MSNDEKTQCIKTRSMKDDTRILKPRQRRQYTRISKEMKHQLIQTVIRQGCKIKKIANDLKINYATAKTIVHSYKRNKLQLQLNPQIKYAHIKNIYQAGNMTIEIRFKGELVKKYDFFSKLTQQ